MAACVVALVVETVSNDCFGCILFKEGSARIWGGIARRIRHSSSGYERSYANWVLGKRLVLFLALCFGCLSASRSQL